LGGRGRERERERERENLCVCGVISTSPKNSNRRKGILGIKDHLSSKATTF
jgi:hypothetical protein